MFRFSFITAILVACLAALPLGAQTNFGRISGSVTDPTGAFTLPNIPIGNQNVTANAPGYAVSTIRARVREGQTANIGYLRIAPLTGGPTLPPPPTPTPTPGPETPVPALTPTPAASASP